MSEPSKDPPLVTRPNEPTATPRLPRPDIWEALLWCLVFLAAQVFGAVVGTTVVFGVFAFKSAEPGQFMEDQLKGFVDATKTNKDGDRAPVPFEIGTALAYGILTAQFTALGLVAVVLPRRIGSDWKRQLGVRRPPGLHILLVLLVVPGFMIGADAIHTAFLWLTGLEPQSMSSVIKGLFGQFPWPLTILAIAIGPGVVEEFWCRGFLGRGLSARHGLLAGVLLTSVFFALMHGDPKQLVVFTLMGAYLHFVYLATRSIWPPILLHACNNGLGVLLELTLNTEQLATFPPREGYLLAFLLLLSGSVALWTSRARIHSQNGEPWAPEYPGISAPPPGSTLRLTHATVSPVALIFTVLSFSALMFVTYRLLV